MTILAFALVLLGAFPADQARSGRGEPTDVFAIYLVADRVDPRITGYGVGDWSQLRLSAAPLIAATDIISYDLSTHSMRLRAEAMAKLPKPPVDGTPFVVVAQGQRVYLGVFVSSVSSHTFAVPAITVDGQLLYPTQPANTLVIERAYPSTSSAPRPDPRGDERIKTALAALGKPK